MIKFFTFLTVMSTLFLSNAYAETKFPPILDGMANYDVKFTTTFPLPNPHFKLTKRAFRILPSFFVDAKPIKKEDIKESMDNGTLELIHTDDMKYCESKKKLCWPKSILATKGYLTVTSWDGNVEYYRDTKFLWNFMWNESLFVLQTTAK